MIPYGKPSGKRLYSHTYEGYGRLEIEIDYDEGSQEARFYPIHPLERLFLSINLGEDD